MKNIHILPTDKPSLSKYLVFNKEGNLCIWSTDTMGSQITLNPQNIYITSDEEIKEGDYYITPNNTILKALGSMLINVEDYKKIILTTDPDLIKDGVQSIDDKFLEWFVKNPSCEEVEVMTQHQYHSSKEFYSDADYVNCSKEQYDSIKKEIPTCPLRILYKIIIPKEEPNQETLEEAMNENGYHDQTNDTLWREGVIFGAKWQQERSYSDEEVIELLQKALTHKDNGETGNLITAQGEIRTANFYSWFEQFKKK